MRDAFASVLIRFKTCLFNFQCAFATAFLRQLVYNTPKKLSCQRFSFTFLYFLKFFLTKLSTFFLARFFALLYFMVTSRVYAHMRAFCWSFFLRFLRVFHNKSTLKNINLFVKIQILGCYFRFLGYLLCALRENYASISTIQYATVITITQATYVFAITIRA